MIYYSCTKQAANISNIYMKDLFMNIIHYYDACRHISYYNQALNGKGVMLILLSMKKIIKV